MSPDTDNHGSDQYCVSSPCYVLVQRSNQISNLFSSILVNVQEALHVSEGNQVTTTFLFANVSEGRRGVKAVLTAASSTISSDIRVPVEQNDYRCWSAAL